MAGQIDFNCDMGEGFGAWRLGDDAGIISCITSANVACGFHAGDPGWMRETVRLAEQAGVAVGAHPGFPDLRGFGRRNMNASAAEVRDDIVYQVGALTAFTCAKRLQHVKPHGALYNMAVDGGPLARAICDAVLETDPGMLLVLLSGSKWAELATGMGVHVAREVFADRAFKADGTLVPRSQPGAVIHDTQAVVERSLRMVSEGRVKAITGEDVDVQADTICLHGDTPGAVRLAEALKSAFLGAGIRLTAMGNVCENLRKSVDGQR